MGDEDGEAVEVKMGTAGHVSTSHFVPRLRRVLNCPWPGAPTPGVSVPGPEERSPLF